MSGPNPSSQVDLLAVIKCQAYIRGFLQRANYKWIKSVKATRYKIVREIYSTEKSYGDTLKHLLEVFKKPLAEDAAGPQKMVTKDDVNTIFSDLDSMYLFSADLQKKLTTVVDSWTENTQIGPIFEKVLAFFKGYSRYLNTHQKAQDLITKLRASNSKFATFLKDRELSPDNPDVVVKIHTYLITPVQRIPRYVLLLQSLVDNTWKSHPDYISLTKALRLANELGDQVNEMKRQREKQDKMLQIHNQITIGKKEQWDKQLLVDQKTRYFVKEGFLTESMIKNEDTKFFAFLFNDLILWTKPKKNTYEFKASNDLKNAKVELKSSSSDTSNVHLRCGNFYRVFRGESEEDTIQWFEAIKACIYALNNSTEVPINLANITLSAEEHRNKAKSIADAANKDSSSSSNGGSPFSTPTKDDRRKPRTHRTTLKLTERRFLEESEKMREQKIAEQVASIREWQQTPDLADLERFEVSEQQVKSMFFTFAPEIYSSFHQMITNMAALSLHHVDPEIVFVGRQNAGKTSLLCALLGYPLPLDNLHRPLFIHLINNPNFTSQQPSIWIRKDYTMKPKVTKDVHVESPDQLAKELVRRRSKEYTDSPIHMFFEANNVINCTLIDTPGLDAFHFHDEPPTPSGKSSIGGNVRSLVFEVARHTHRQLVFVEESKSKGLMSTVSGLATFVDPGLSRSFFIYTKFHHVLRDMWQHTQLNAYMTSLPANTILVTLPSSASIASVSSDQARLKLMAQAYVRDLDIMDMLQYDTKYSTTVGIHNAARFMLNWIYKQHLKSIPYVLEQMNNLNDQLVKQSSALVPRTEWLKTMKLRHVANSFTYDVVKTLPGILFGSTSVEAKVYGHTLDEETYKLEVANTYWVDFYNQPILPPNHSWHEIHYSDAKLYGSAQLIRLFSVFNEVVQALQVRSVPPEQIAAVAGHTLTVEDLINAALTIAHDTAEKAFLPLVEQLCRRASEMIKRVGSIAVNLVDSEEVSNGTFKKEMDIPLFAGYVRVQYEHYGGILGQQCLEECTGALDSVLISDPSKYQTSVKSSDSHSLSITKLVSLMFKDISRLFVRNVTAKCYDILVARGVEEIGRMLQANISALSDKELLQLFDVDSFKLEIEAEQQQITMFEKNLKENQSEFIKSSLIFSDKKFIHSSHNTSLVSYKKLPYEEGSASVEAVVPRKLSAAKENREPNKASKHKDDVPGVAKPKEPSREAPKAPVARQPSEVSTPKDQLPGDQQPVKEDPPSKESPATATPAKVAAPAKTSSEAPAKNAASSPTKPETAKVVAVTPVAESKPDTSATSLKVNEPTAKTTGGMAKSPSAGGLTKAAAPSTVTGTASAATTAVPSTEIKSVAKKIGAIVPSSGTPTVSTPSTPNSGTASPGTAAAKEVIPPNNAANKKAAFEKIQDDRIQGDRRQIIIVTCPLGPTISPISHSMGVPSYFKWLASKYGKTVIDALEDKGDEVDGQKTAPDLTAPNPNGVEFDNLYLDMNGIIHPCSHPENKIQPTSEYEIMQNIFEYIDHLFSIVRPRRLLYMAIDGVAPRAKLNQQRSRRFRSAKESREKKIIQEKLLQTALSEGKMSQVEFEQAKHEAEAGWHFDSNSITPGTDFMDKVAKSIRYYAYERLSNNPGWKNIQVIISDASVPGEGEHKIMDFIRHQRGLATYDPNTKHVLYGLDADLIMLGLATHEPNFTILREFVAFGRPNPNDRFAREAGQPEIQRPFQFLRLNVLREYLAVDLKVEKLPFEWDLERALDDYVFLCFFVGNDFLPHMPTLEIREGAIELLIEIYKKVLPRLDGYLTHDGEIDLPRLEELMKEVGSMENEILQRRKDRNKQRQQKNWRKEQAEKNIAASSVSNSMLIDASKDTLKSLPNHRIDTQNKNAAASLRQKLQRTNSASGSTGTRIDSDSSSIEMDVSELSRGHSMDATPALSPSSTPSSTPSHTPAPRIDVNEPMFDGFEEGDTVRLGESGWQERYYTEKFHFERGDDQQLRRVTRCYMEGLVWVLRYYYQGCCSWTWYYPYHFAPFAVDITDIPAMAPLDLDLGEPFRPFEQLMGVLPAASQNCLPEPYHALMSSPTSPIIDFYPEDFELDFNGKKQEWLAVALLPFIDQNRLLEAVRPIHASLSEEEKIRNSFGKNEFIVSKFHPSGSRVLELQKKCAPKVIKYQKKIPSNIHIQEKFYKKKGIELDPAAGGSLAGTLHFSMKSPAVDVMFIAPFSEIGSISENHAVSAAYDNPYYASEHKFSATLLPNAVLPDPTLDDTDKVRRRLFSPGASNADILEAVLRSFQGLNGPRHTQERGRYGTDRGANREHPYSRGGGSRSSYGDRDSYSPSHDNYYGNGGSRGGRGSYQSHNRGRGGYDNNSSDSSGYRGGRSYSSNYRDSTSNRGYEGRGGRGGNNNFRGGHHQSSSSSSNYQAPPPNWQPNTYNPYPTAYPPAYPPQNYPPPSGYPPPAYPPQPYGQYPSVGYPTSSSGSLSSSLAPLLASATQSLGMNQPGGYPSYQQSPYPSYPPSHGYYPSQYPR